MKPIPQPDPYPLLGNVPDLEPEAITESMPSNLSGADKKAVEDADEMAATTED